MWDCESEPVGGQGYGNGVISTSKPGLPTYGFQKKGHSWFVSTDIPSDFIVLIGDVSFHLHKCTLLSRCGKINKIMYESCDENLSKIELDEIPGGHEAFKLAAKFCYETTVGLTANNISGLRCAAEYLEMTEDLEEGNLISKTEAFLSYVVLSSFTDSITVLKSCESLSPWAENLRIVRRCSDSIASRACTDTKKPCPNINDSVQAQAPPDHWWFEDVSILRIDHFVRVMTAVKVKGMRYELIGAVIMHYAGEWLYGLNKDSEKSNISNTNGSQEQRMIVESLISIIPPQRDSISCNFLLRLLRRANMLRASPALVTELEKRAGIQFENAALGDLLIPSYDKNETLMYDVDLVQRLLEHFLVQEISESSRPNRQLSFDNLNSKMMIVASLVDSYLAVVSRDRNMSLTRFQVLAEALPESARTCDDGLYRAVDSYLKAHPALTEHERKRLFRVMHCHKLSTEARKHAARNERVPLRVIIQVLFSNQVKLIRETCVESTAKDVNKLRSDVESIKAKYLELENEMETLQIEFNKVAKPNKHITSSSAWTKLSKFGKTMTGNIDARLEEPRAKADRI